MRTRVLPAEEILSGYDAVSALYPHVPSLSHWRAWELAAYRRHRVSGRVLDLGCGDGRYFRLVWPDATDVVGVDMAPQVVALARSSGIYRQVHETQATRIPEADASFDHVFANCSLEHMDGLAEVLAEVCRCLKPDGTLLCSVVTDRFVSWSPLPKLVALAGHPAAATALEHDFLAYHHLANPLPVAEWIQAFESAGLAAEDHYPILPKHNSAMFLLMDSLWHVKREGGGEFGDVIHPALQRARNFPTAFRKVFEGVLEMESDWQDCCGAVFVARRSG